MTNILALTARNSARWAAAKLTRGPEFVPVAKCLVAAKSRYEIVSAKTNVPWFIIAVIHERESSQNFSRSLAQGDPWDRISIHVPKGRGPFSSWEAAAEDALVVCPPHVSQWTDWTPGGAMTLLEQYNGLGYASKDLPSPYVWSGTDQYIKGKYVADGHYDPNVVDKQLGCAGMILSMHTLDSSIAFASSVVSPPTLSKGASGVSVQTLQKLLNARGASLNVDGDFGTMTKTAVQEFQRTHNLVPDGIVGPYTWLALKEIA